MICLKLFLYWFPYSILVSGDLCCLLITFANSLFPDQCRQNVGPDLDTDRLTLLLYSLKMLLKKFILKKKSADDNESIKLTQRAKIYYIRLIEIMHVSMYVFVE